MNSEAKPNDSLTAEECAEYGIAVPKDVELLELYGFTRESFSKTIAEVTAENGRKQKSE